MKRYMLRDIQLAIGFLLVYALLFRFIVYVDSKTPIPPQHVQITNRR